MSDAVARAPFQFVGCVELRQALDPRAIDERELLQRLEDVPAGSVFFHTLGYFLRHRPITTAYGNDFAAWVAVHVRDQVLAERLAVIDPFESATVEELREELVTVIHDHLLRLPSVPRVEFGEPFTSSSRTSSRCRWARAAHAGGVPGGPGRPWTTAPSISTWWRRARGWAALRRLRRVAADSLELPQLAERIERIDAYMTSLERVRARVLSLVDVAIEGAEGGVGTGPA